jgi:xylulokinase
VNNDLKMKKKRLSLGLDLSTQGITAVVLDIGGRGRVYEHALDYCRDPRLNVFGIRGEDYILPPEREGEANQPAEMFLAAIDAIFSDLREAVPLEDIAVINSSGQQHGHVYLNHRARELFQRLKEKDAGESDLASLLKGGLAWGMAPIWMTADTQEDAEHIRKYLGGKERAIELCGSDIPLRFTGVVMRRNARLYPEMYRQTDNIQLISSLVPAILTGNSRAAIDYGNGGGTALMDYRRKGWSGRLIKAAAEGLEGGEKAFRRKLPALAAPDSIAGNIAGYFVRNYGFSPGCKIAAGSGDNPQSKVLVAGDLLSLGTSLVYMVVTDGKTLDMNGYANAMYDGLGRPFIFGCRTNGAMVWDRIRARYGLAKEEYRPAEAALRETPVGQGLVFWQPRTESFPPSGSTDIIRIGGVRPGLGTDYGGVIEASLAAVYHYSQGFSRETREPLYVTGGARNSAEILRRVAAIWERPIIPVAGGGAALGAAVAGAYALGKSAGETTEISQYIDGGILEKGQPISPADDDVQAFHRAGGYLDRFARAEKRLPGR